MNSAPVNIPGAFLGLILIALFGVGCEGVTPIQGDSEEKQTLQEVITIHENGWLVIPSTEAFLEVRERLSSDQGFLRNIDWLDGFTSFFTAWSAIDDAEYERIAESYASGNGIGSYGHLIYFDQTTSREFEEVPQITSPTMQWLANEKGIIQIGDSLKKYTYYWVITVPLDEHQLVEALQIETDFFDEHWNKYRTRIKRSPLTIQHMGTRAGNNRDDIHYLNNRRIQGRTEWQDDGFAQEVSSVTRHQRRIIGFIWVADRVDEIHHRSTGFLVWGDQDPTIVNVDETLQSVRSTPSYTLGWCHSFCLRTDIDIAGTHRCTQCDNGLVNQTANTDYVMPWP